MTSFNIFKALIPTRESVLKLCTIDNHFKVFVFTCLGARPYMGMKAAKIRQMLRTGYRMPQPNHCSEQL